MINERYQNAYAEVLYYLKGIRQNDIIKIPKGLIRILRILKILIIYVISIIQNH